MDSSVRGFELAPGIDETTFAGTFAFGEDTLEFDVRAELDAGNGIIATDDPQLIAALRDYKSLVELQSVPAGATLCAVPGGNKEVEAVPANYIPQSGKEDETQSSEGEDEGELSAELQVSGEDDHDQPDAATATVSDNEDNDHDQSDDELDFEHDR